MSRRRPGPNEPYIVLARRFAGFVIDVAIIATVVSLVGPAIAATAPSGRSLPTGTLLAEWVVLVGLWVGYWVVLAGHFGATLGQWTVRVRVVADGSRIGMPRQLLRCAVAPIALAPVGIGYIWAILDRRFRSLVDIVSRTTVMGVRELSADEPGDDWPYADDHLSEASAVLVDRVATVADALAAAGHWRAAGVLAALVASFTSDQDVRASAGWAFARAGDVTNALEITSSATTRPLARAARALALARVGDVDGAADAFRGAVGLPDDIVAIVEVELAIAAEDLDAADARARAFTDQAPASLDAWLLAFEVARLRDNHDELSRRAEQAVQLAPGNVDALQARASALGPGHASLHGLASRAEIDALVAVLDADPVQAETLERLSTATSGQRRARLVVAALLGCFGLAQVIGLLAGRYGIGNLVLGPLLVAIAVATVVRFRAVRDRLDSRSRPWVTYLDAFAIALNQQASGRTPAPIDEAMPTESVLGTPNRCWCATLQHTHGRSAVQYVHEHLVESEPSPAPGVHLLRCPDGRGMYVALDGGVLDEDHPAELYRVDAQDLDRDNGDIPVGLSV